MSDRPRISGWEHAHRYPERIVVIWAPLHGGHEWLVMRGTDVLATYPTHAEAFAEAWARTHPEEAPDGHPVCDARPDDDPCPADGSAPSPTCDGRSTPDPTPTPRAAPHLTVRGRA